MSRTVSFRASEELDEFLEQEAERRMTTKSTVAQMLVAERAREIRGGEVEEPPAVEPEEETPESEEETPEAEDAGIGEDSGLPPIFERHSDRWYVPDSDRGYKFAVKLGGDADTGPNYYKTVEGAEERLREEYES